MPYYMVQAAYTSDAWAAQIKQPANRAEQLRAMMEKVGAKLVSFYYSYGEYDVVLIVEAPDNVKASAGSLAAAAGGAIKSIKTTPLLTAEEGVEAMRLAGASGYRPPGR